MSALEQLASKDAVRRAEQKDRAESIQVLACIRAIAPIVRNVIGRTDVADYSSGMALSKEMTEASLNDAAFLCEQISRGGATAWMVSKAQGIASDLVIGEKDEEKRRLILKMLSELASEYALADAPIVAHDSYPAEMDAADVRAAYRLAIAGGLVDLAKLVNQEWRFWRAEGDRDFLPAMAEGLASLSFRLGGEISADSITERSKFYANLSMIHRVFEIASDVYKRFGRAALAEFESVKVDAAKVAEVKKKWASFDIVSGVVDGVSTEIHGVFDLVGAVWNDDLIGRALEKASGEVVPDHK